MILKRIFPWLAFVAVVLFWLASTSPESAQYHYRQHHKPDGEPVNVAEVMGRER